MENHKDNNKGQFPNVVFELKNIGFFDGDEYSLYLYKKTEKMVTALYLVSNLVPDVDPIKTRVKEEALCLLSFAISFGTSNAGDREVIALKISESALKIISFLEISFYAGYISQMNYSILKREFAGLLDLIEKKEKITKEKKGFVLSENFFSVPEKYTPAPVSPGSTEINKGQYPVGNGTKIGHQNGLHPRGARPAIKDIGERKDSRKALILSLLKKESNLTIKDFSKVIPDCSEKTIQRELLQLVNEGVLKKVGERRWSRYSLV